MDAFETWEHAGMTCELHQDVEPASPAEWDQLGTLASLPSIDRDAPGEPQSWRVAGDDEDAADRGGAALLVRYLHLARGIVAVPFRFSDYGSSGSRIRAQSLDEDAPSGYIFTTRERCAELGVDLSDAERQLRGELDEWDAYFQGLVVGFVVRDSAGAVVESVWGFYPDEQGDGYDEARREAENAAECEHDERARTRREYIASGARLR